MDLGMCENYIQILPWDCEFFGKKIGRIIQIPNSVQEMEKVLSESEIRGIECLYWNPPLTACYSKIAEATLFSLKDIPTHLSLKLDEHTVDGPSSALSFAHDPTDADMERMKELARKSHHQTRFYADEQFDVERCDELYAVWIENCAHSELGTVLLIKDSGNLVGYVACSLDSPLGKTGRISLIAVSAEYQGCGYGAQLIDSAKIWLLQAGVKHVNVTTQASNISALRLYHRAGFQVSSVSMWYHWWRDRKINF